MIGKGDFMYEDYYFRIDEDELSDDRVFVLIIYDIISNKSRNKFSKLLLGYGFRIQKSAFEAVITKNKLMKLLTEIPRYINENEDSVRLYQIKGKGNVTSWGKNENYDVDEVIIL